MRFPRKEFICIGKTNGVAETLPISEKGSISCNANKFATSDGSCANASNSMNIREVCSLVGPHCAGNVYGH